MQLHGSPGAPRAENREKLFSLACELFRLGAASQAYLLFSGLEDGREAPALCVNLALCRMRAKQWELAKAQLEQALALLKRQPLRTRGPDDGICRLLAAVEGKGEGYLQPLPEEAPQYAPEYAAATIRRLLVDCCAELGIWERVRQLATTLASGGYENVEQALRKAGG